MTKCPQPWSASRFGPFLISKTARPRDLGGRLSLNVPMLMPCFLPVGTAMLQPAREGPPIAAQRWRDGQAMQATRQGSSASVR